MNAAAQPTLGASDDSRLAHTRLQFLTAEPLDTDQVREAILASWWRSREFRVPADRIDLPYAGEQNLDTPLIRGAEPVMRRLGDQLEGQPISIILTDPNGVVLTQHTGDSDLHRHLESVELVPGFSYGEQYVGTNGIGTALEDGRPMHVFGHEHYAENLEDLACAGVPIRHPISGKTIGAVDLTCWRKDAGRLLIALARTTGEQIQQALLTHSNMRELTLFHSYLKACRRTTGIVIAFNNDIMMMNDCAHQLLDPADQSVLLENARSAMAEGRPSTSTVALPTGTRVRMRCRRVAGPRDDVAGGVVSVQLLEPDEDVVGGRGAMLPHFVPGLVGSSPLWLRCCHEVDASYTAGEWLAIAGESGVGKCAVAMRVHQRRNPAERLHMLDATRSTEAGWLDSVRRELFDEGPRALVIRNVDRLDAATSRALASVLGEFHEDGGAAATWVAVTLATEAESDPNLADVLARFARTVEIPPLRHHVDDIRELVPLFLSKLCRDGRLRCSPAAMHLLMRASWPGNVAELYRVLKSVSQHRRAGAIQPADLPAHFRTASRRQLNRLESMERDAIVQCLEDAGGSKARAAKLLGMSRATIYRRIHEYGIVVPKRDHE